MTDGDGGYKRRRGARELAFIAGLALTVFWLLPLAILAMNAVKSPQEYLLTSGLTLPSTFNLFDNVARAWAKGLSSGFVNSLIYGAGRLGRRGVPGGACRLRHRPAEDSRAGSSGSCSSTAARSFRSRCT